MRLDVTVDGKRADGPLDVTVGERQYTEEELQQVFSRAGRSWRHGSWERTGIWTTSRRIWIW